MMDTQQILFNFQLKRYKVFEAQDSEDDDFDVVFEIDGKKLYANKFILCPISTTFKSMLSDRWTKPDEVVKIEEYTFEDYKEFLTFIYSGKCKLTDDNIFAMVDIAEFYGIQELKDVCGKYLSGILNLENVHQMVELACKYSLKEFKTYLDRFVMRNFIVFFKSDQFQNLQKTTVKELVDAHQETWYQDELFEEIFKWAENRALENQKLYPGSNINEKIKDELSEILPLIKFERMNSIFFHEFVAKQTFLFSGIKWNEILLARKTKLFVKVTDVNGKIMKGEVQCGDIESVANVIESIKDQSCADFCDDCCYWKTKQPRPSMPSKLIKNDKIEWYLVYDVSGNIAIVNRNMLLGYDYLLAEMFAENGFEIFDDCKIKICSRF